MNTGCHLQVRDLVVRVNFLPITPLYFLYFDWALDYIPDIGPPLG